MADLTVQVIAFLVVAAFVAGFIDSIAGGGGMIALPALLIAGVPPLETLGTAKLQSLFGSGSASLAYARRGHVHLRTQLPLAVISAAGAAVGALAATVMPAYLLRLILPFLLIAIALFFAVKPDIDDSERARKIGAFAFAATLVPAIGFYDGIFGPGTGSFFMLALVTLAGFGVLKATAHTKVLNFGSNLGSFVVFAVSGAVLWKLGLMMGAGQFLGAQLGSRLAIRSGARIIKPMLILSCVALTTRLLADPTHPIRVWAGF
ncbi:TSUP family transporter [Ensifer soli]|uniref:TSUP family transporter n=1 Tax=Ciceribacter sp. sgz301302 TaxID=3342379 RepID=UPI0035BA62F7